MAGQLSSFVQKFCSLWQAGNDARLNIECHAGKAQIHLQLSLHHPPHHPHHQPQHQPHHQPPPPPQHQPRRHPGPSRLRRSARRGLARATAAKAATLAAETAAQQVENDDNAPAFALPHPPHQDVPAHLAAAAQAGQVSAERADDDVPLQQQHEHDPVPPHQAAAGQAVALPAEQAQLSPQPTQVRDQVCPDYENLPAAQVVPPPHHQASSDAHTPHEVGLDAPLHNHQPTPHTPLHVEPERQHGLRRQLLQQRHHQAHHGHQPTPQEQAHDDQHQEHQQAHEDEHHPPHEHQHASHAQDEHQHHAHHGHQPALREEHHAHQPTPEEPASVNYCHRHKTFCYCHLLPSSTSNEGI